MFARTAAVLTLCILAGLLPCQAASGGDAKARQKPVGQEAGAGNTAAAKLSGYLKEAGENNLRLKAAYHRFQAALEKIPQATSLEDPRLNLGYFLVPVETRVGPQRARIGVAQMIPWIGKLIAKGDRAALEADAEKGRFDALRLSIFYEVKRVYYEYAYLLRAIDITRENRELLDYLEGVINARYTAGVSPYSDLLAVQVERDKLDDRLRTMEDFKHPLEAAMNAVLSRDMNAPFADVPDIPVITAKLDGKELAARLDAVNPQLKVFEYLAGSQKKSEALARMDYIPDVTVGLETVLTDSFNAYRGARNATTGVWQATGPPPSDSGKDAVIASVSLNIPLWFGKREAAIREAKARQLAAVSDRDGLRDKLTSDLKLALYNYRDAERKLDLYKTTLIPRAEQSLGASLTSYQAAKGSFMDLINTQRTLLEFELNHIRAMATQAQRLAEIESLVGDELLYTVSGSFRDLSTYKMPGK